jgi:DNA repair exonuclease SbcCD ATPase subunit
LRKGNKAMSQNVSQWLDEIKGLKQRLSAAQQEREEAYASAINWQRLYETEAQQRRIEAETARQTIAALQQELQQFKGDPAQTQARIQANVDRLNSEVEVRSRLVQALAECDRLAQALETEQTNHIQTRKSLTTALGDAIDALKGKK